jgi:hypothetical protein
MQVVVRKEDAPRIAQQMRDEWNESLEREGFAPVDALPPAGEDGEPPCPACGTAAPLKDGACSDCGLQLE